MLKTYGNIKLDVFLLQRQILAFVSHPKMVRESNVCLQISSKLCGDVLRY